MNSPVWMEPESLVAPHARSQGRAPVAMLRWSLVRLAVYGIPTVLILSPMALFLISSFWSMSNGKMSYTWTLANYRAFFQNPSYWGIYLQTIKLAGIVALFGLVSGYIVAYLIWRQRGPLRYMLLLFSVIPLAMNYIVKVYAMRAILGFNGVLNAALVWSGILAAPSTLFVFNQTAVLIAMAVIYLPFAILPIFLSLERIPHSLVEASADLGAPPGQTFRRVVLPLSLPGSIVGGLFVMVLSLGDFLTPQMVGGNQGFTFGRAIWSQFGMAFNWPFGAALAVMLLLAIAVLLTLARLLTLYRRTS